MSPTSEATEAPPAPPRTAIEIGLPLPLDVVSTIGNLINGAYPGTDIDTTAGHGRLRLLLPSGARKAKSLSKRAVKAAVAEPVEPEEESQLLGWDSEDGTAIVSLSAPQSFAAAMLPLVRDALDSTEGAANYVEQTLVEKEPPYRRFVAIACRSEAQTPHELRHRAELDRAQAQAQRDEALALIDEILAVPDVLGSNDSSAAQLALEAFRARRESIRSSMEGWDLPEPT